MAEKLPRGIKIVGTITLVAGIVLIPLGVLMLFLTGW